MQNVAQLMVGDGIQLRITGDYARGQPWTIGPSLPVDQPTFSTVPIQADSTLLP